MKKSVMFLACAICMAATASAQEPFAEPCGDCDTIPGRYGMYHYHQWYDSCQGFITNGYEDDPCYTEQFALGNPLPTGRDVAKPFETAEPMRIRGMVAMANYAYTPEYTVLGTERLPEYLYLWQGTDGDGLVLVDSLRWDTVKPYIMELPLKADGSEKAYCYAFEVFFDEPVTVYGTYYISGSTNSNVVGDVRTENGTTRGYLHLPTKYCSVEGWMDGSPCSEEYPSRCTAQGDFRLRAWNARTQEYYWMYYAPESVFGYFLPIGDNYRLVAKAEDSRMGTTRGSGIYAYGSECTVEAVTVPGFRFTEWSDGVSDNPRNLHMDRDWTLTAHFEADGGEQPTMTLSPNPTRGSIDIQVKPAADYSYEVCDVRGTLIMTGTFIGTDTRLDISALTPGTYYLRVRSAGRTVTSMFVKQ